MAAMGKLPEAQYAVHFSQVMSEPEMDEPVRARPVVPSAMQGVEAAAQPVGTLWVMVL